MKRDVVDILKEALELSAEARATLAEHLLDSLNPRSDGRRRQSFAHARRRAVKRLRDGLDLGWVPAPREDLHR
jgi:hypothetical protein